MIWDQTKWSKPIGGLLKCNVDAPINEQLLLTYFGTGVRNEDGSFPRSIHGSIPFTIDSNLVEAIALKESLLWLRHLGWDHLEVKMDSLTIATEFNANTLKHGVLLHPTGLACDNHYHNLRRDTPLLNPRVSSRLTKTRGSTVLDIIYKFRGK